MFELPLSLVELIAPCVGVLPLPVLVLLLLATELVTVPFMSTPLLVLLELELFNTGKFAPPPAVTFVLLLLLLLLLVLLLLVLLDDVLQCAFGILPVEGVRTADGSIDSEPIAVGSPASNGGSL